MGRKTIKICDCCEKEIDDKANCIHFNGESNFGIWKSLEFCDILCFLSYMDGNIRAYKEALEADVKINNGDITPAQELIHRLLAGLRDRHSVQSELALVEKYTSKFPSNPFEEAEKAPDGIRKIVLDD